MQDKVVREPKDSSSCIEDGLGDGWVGTQEPCTWKSIPKCQKRTRFARAVHAVLPFSASHPQSQSRPVQSPRSLAKNRF